MSEHLAKGRPVFIEGRLKLDQWQDKEGNNRSKLKVVVVSFQFVDSRNSSGSNPGGRASAPQPVSAASTPHQQPVNEDDIPFGWLLVGSLTGLYAAADHAWALDLLQAWA